MVCTEGGGEGATLNTSNIDSKSVVEDSKKKERVKVVYTNIDGYVSKKLEVDDYAREMEPHIMCFVETKLDEKIQIMDVGDRKYRIWRRDRRGKKGGGVMIAVRKDIIVDKVELGEGKAEVLSMRMLTEKGGKRDIVVVYVPPKTRAWNGEEYEEMLNDTCRCLERLLKESRNIILMGDFNCKEVNWEEWDTEGGEDSWGNRILNLAMRNVMTQWIKEATRYRGTDEASRLDLLLTKEPDIIGKIKTKCPLGKSDHVLIEFDLNEGNSEEKDESYRKGRFNYGKTDFVGLRKFFEEVNWNELKEEKNTQDKWRIFLKYFSAGVEKYVPKITMKEKKKKEWFNKRCEKAKVERDKSWNKMRRRDNQQTRDVYKRARNEYVRVRREEERNYEKNIVNKCKEEPKLFYRYVNGKLKKKDGIEKLKLNGEIYEEARKQAEVMNKSFQSVFTKEGEFEREQRVTKERVLSEINVGVEELKKLMKNLDVRKAQGPDGVSNWILRECRDQLVEQIHNIIESSLQEGKVPSEWKCANIVPIYKGGNREEPLNYRPVSLTSVVSKMCEKIIKERWMKYLVKENILTAKQFGFREGRSCVTNLMSFYSRVIDVVQEREGWADCIYLDFRKAFDTVPHKRLLWKLEQIGGLKGNILEWIKDYLTDRMMRTVIRDEESEWRQVTSGVPQGSVLAPIMFMIYINDMVEGVDSYMSLFADDAKIMRKIRNIKDCEELQSDLDRIYKWSRVWEMDFNAKKCRVLEMGKSERRPTWNYKLGSEVVLKGNEEKDLGVIIQDKLLAEKHISRITGETYNLLIRMRMVFNYMDEDMMKKLIVGLIRPRLEYAAVVWSPHKKKNVRKVERIQRVATKMVPSLRDRPYEERLEILNLQTLKERRERGDLIAVFRAMKGLEKVDREDLFVWDRSATRGHGKKLKKSRCLRDIKKYSFPYRTVDAWNGLKPEIVQAKSIHEFKMKLDNIRYGDRTARA